MERGGAGLTCNLETDVKKKAKKRDLSKTTKTQKKSQLDRIYIHLYFAWKTYLAASKRPTMY